jgi:hypothetical protein
VLNSYSSLSLFEQCPAAFHAIKVVKLYPFRATPETEFGNRAHEALENYGKHGTPLPAEFSNYQWVCDGIIDQLGPRRAFEYEFAFNRTGHKVGLKDWSNKWFMGMADVLDIDGTHALVVDYKTGGSRYPKVQQLSLMSLFVFLEFPEVETVSGLLLFLQDGVAYPPDGAATWSRAEHFDALWAEWQGKGTLVEEHVRMGVWPATPNNLCGWCVHTTCPHQAPALAKREAKAARFAR